MIYLFIFCLSFYLFKTTKTHFGQRVRGGMGRGGRGTWVGKHVRPEIWVKGYFTEPAGYSDCSNRVSKPAKMWKRVYFFTKILNKKVLDRMFFTVFQSKLRDHNKDFFQRWRAHPRKVWEAPSRAFWCIYSLMWEAPSQAFWCIYSLMW